MLVAGGSHAIACRMADDTPSADDAPTPAGRIEAALARIEAAARARAEDSAALAARHAALRARMTEAVSALDDVLARGNG